MPKNIVVAIIVLGIVGVLALFFEDSENSKVIVDKKEMDKEVKKGISEQKKNDSIKIVYKDDKKDLQKKKNTKIANEEKKVSDNEQNNNDDANENPLDIDEQTMDIIENGYVATSQKVGDYQVEIVSPQKVKKDPNIPPSIPIIVTGSVDGEKYSLSIPREQAQKELIVVFKAQDKISGVVKIDPNKAQALPIVSLPPQTSTQEGTLVQSDQPQEEAQEEPVTQPVSTHIVPPSVPSF